MIKKIFVALSLFSSLGLSTALAQEQKNTEAVEEYGLFSLTDTLSTSKLLADKVEILNLIRKEKEARDESIEEEIKAKELAENLEAPAEEIYGTCSWGQAINPIHDSSLIPSSYDIDLTGFVAPIKYYRTNSNYGMRGRRRRRMHHGVDLKLYTGEEVRAVFDGKVRIKRFNRRGYGYYYVIRHPNGLETVYGHLSKQIAKQGQIVKAGDVIGLGGSTGRSSGPHLHFEARFCGIPLNPQMLFDFAEGAPRMDTYTFNKYGRSHYAKHEGSSKGKVSHYQVYRVRKGDSLDKIAKRHNTTVARLCQANHISKRSMIKPGDKLLIQ